MSGSLSSNTTEDAPQFAEIMAAGNVGSPLTHILTSDAITPGNSPSYELCKLLYSFHPIGAKMAEAPVNMAQSQDREISIPVDGEERLVAEFLRIRRQLGNGVGADALIKNLKVQSRVYGIATLIIGDRVHPENSDRPLDFAKLHETEPYFTVLDPLNTAGSLILEQDPNSPDFQKPKAVRVGARTYHPSRCVVCINESPFFILWSDSAFGFSGRSVYQRALYPMKTLLQSMITDQLVTIKCGLLVYKAKAPGSIMNNRIMQMFSFKRQQLKAGVTGQVLNIGTDEEIESLNFQNLEGPATMARNNALKNCAMAASMPAKMLEQEELVEGLAEGTEDAKQIARFIDRLRIEMFPEYAFLDRVSQRLAWTPEFYKVMQRLYPDAYKSVPYETAFYGWANAFQANWPNLLAEPPSKKMETEKIRFEAVVALLETMKPLIRSPENQTELLAWAADEINSRRELFTSPLNIDQEAELAAPSPEMVGAGQEREPSPFSSGT